MRKLWRSKPARGAAVLAIAAASILYFAGVEAPAVDVQPEVAEAAPPVVLEQIGERNDEAARIAAAQMKAESEAAAAAADARMEEEAR